MKTEIEFLRELEEHLMEAARREPQPVVKRRIRPTWWRRYRVQLLAGGTAAFIAVSGAVGYFLTQGSPASRVGVQKAADTRRELFSHLTLVAGPTASPSPAPADQFGRTSVPLVPSSGGSVVGPNVIKTADLAIRVAKGTFAVQFGKVTQIAGANGGYVQTSSVQDGRSDSGSIIIRVPADHFELALASLRALGHVDRDSISGQDVTAKFVDLAARLHNAEAKVGVLRRLLAKAPTVAATLRVSNALSNAQLEVEELQGELRVLSNRTDLGTIQVSLYERELATATPPATGQTAGGAWHDAVHGFFGVVFSVVVGLGYLVPISLLVALAGVLIWLGVRRSRNRVVA